MNVEGMVTGFSTADLCDEYKGDLQILDPAFMSFGKPIFSGEIHTVSVLEDNSLVREILERPGNGRVLVISGRGIESPALVGDNLGKLAVENKWVGIVVNGAVRDTPFLNLLPVGVRARRVFPARAWGGGTGDEGQVVRFGGVVFRPGSWLYADEDGVVLADRRLSSD
ncbi:ribonuclease E activity regulator RraA [Parafrankia elaeagni]|uniref:ribonuclease E activity regulator RraA n=1 Tax=Parafrankia elaeagni TaxID=222534 RepID=UPI0003A320D3|nr:ribonuclease E activity regulator RraA [Parafrankia elaeagni]